MQTFLPYPSFSGSASVLDNRRLANQRNEALVILKQLLGLYERGWPNHPAVRMWRGHETSLRAYIRVVCAECVRRGIQDTVLARLEEIEERLSLAPLPLLTPWPYWLGYEAFHRAHRSSLLRKDPGYYGALPGFDVPNDLPYVWPETNGSLRA